MARMGPRMGLRMGPVMGPNPLFTADPLVGFSATFTTDVDGDPSTLMLSAEHAAVDGSGPFRLTTTGSLPSGFLTGTDYYAITAGLDSISLALADSFAHAIANIRLSFSDNGTGVHTITYTG